MKDLAKMKERFDNESEEKSIKKDIDEIENEIITLKFNPDTRALSVLHDILDSIQDIQNKLGKLKSKALKEELRVDLCFADANNVYGDRFDEIMGTLQTDKITKGEKDSKVKRMLFDEGIVNYVRYFENKKIKIKSIIRRIDVLIKVIDEMDDKNSRKISLMQLQKDLGTLVDIKLKEEEKKE